MSEKNILTPEAIRFTAELARNFKEQHRGLLERRRESQQDIDRGILPRFFENTREIRENNSWKVSPAPADIRKRWVEITGPASSRKMVVNALNSGADVYMADAEDSESPAFSNLIAGQRNLYDAVCRTIDFSSGEKEYRLNEKTAVLMFRPRGLHLFERHMLDGGGPIPAALFDFGMYLAHNARNLLRRNTAPYFYLPKLEHYFEARWWNEVCEHAESQLNLPQNSIRVTVLIETLPAAFQMEEILYELRGRILGLNCGRWDYIFSFIKKLRAHKEFVLPDRSELTMDKHFLASYAKLLIATCHRRGAYAMGGMAAHIPINNNPQANEEALAKVRADKLREVTLGHDGTWVAHPKLVPIAMEIFAKYMPGENQIAHHAPPEPAASAQDLLSVPEGNVTYGGLQTNIVVGVQYIDAWLSGNGCVPINNLMEDAATAEISRAQVWQWLRHHAKLSSGQVITPALVEEIMEESTLQFSEAARKLFWQLVTATEFAEFLTLPAYEKLCSREI